MIIKDRMTKNVITITANENINKAMDIMADKGLHRLPVVNGNKLVGLLTKSMISQKGASKATSLSIFELNYLLSKINVSTIMEKKVITIYEDQLFEDAADLMLRYDIGCLPVLNKKNELVGILTQNDLFKAFIEVLGYNVSGSRVSIKVEDGLGVLEKVAKIFTDHNNNIANVGVYDLEDGSKNLIFRTTSEETASLEVALKEAGYEVLDIRKF